jgi:APA family basic amino acid/polyamine antiporter
MSHKDSRVAQPSLVRALGAWDAASITVGTVLGSAVFIAAAFVPAAVPHPSMVLGVWLAGGLLSLAGALCFAELGAMFPYAGGIYHYLKETYGPFVGFLFGWTSFLVIQCGSLAYLGVAFAEYLGAFIPAIGGHNTLCTIPLGAMEWTVSSGQVTAGVTIAVFTVVNYFGVKHGARAQNVLTLIKIAALVGMIGAGLLVAPTVSPDWAAPLPPVSFAAVIGVALIGVFGSFDGWYQAAFSAGEMRRPERDLPRGMIMGTAAMVVAYLLVNLVYLRALPIEAMSHSTRVGEAAAVALFGSTGGRLLAAAVVVSVLGCLATCILTAARIYQPMAEDGLFFRSLAYIHPRYRTPTTSLIAQGVWGTALALSGTYEQLLNYVVFAVFVFHALTGAAVVVLRYTRPLAERPYRVWGYPWVPILFAGSAAAFVVNTLIERPFESFVGVGLMALGVPAYMWWRRDAVPGRSGVVIPEKPA